MEITFPKMLYGCFLFVGGAHPLLCVMGELSVGMD